MSTLDRYQYGYDGNSNRLYKANVVGTPIVSGGLDELYSYDNLNRLIVMQRGTLNGTNTGITGTPSREMDYTLDPTGNWSSYLTKTSGTTDLNQTRTANKVNEITAIGGTPGWATPPAYDAAGNMTTMPQPETPGSAFTTTYDAWNRMASISDSGGTVANYQYDGQGRRIVKTTTATSEIRHFYHTNQWQDIEERVGTSTSSDQQYVWGIRYVDELVCRDDPTHGRLYAMQDANYNLTSICDTSATVNERYYYDPYGNRMIMDGSWSSIGTSAYNWVIGHQGLLIDKESQLYYVRNRYLHSILGNWNSRDSKGYIDSLNLYLFELGNPDNKNDPSGTDVQSNCESACRKAYGANAGPDYRDCIQCCVLAGNDKTKAAGCLPGAAKPPGPSCPIEPPPGVNRPAAFVKCLLLTMAQNPAQTAVCINAINVCLDFPTPYNPACEIAAGCVAIAGGLCAASAFLQ